MAYAVFPPIGIARIGNSPTDFYVAPERRGSLGTELSAGGTEKEVTAFKDAQFRVKRQAARFQVFAISAAGRAAPAQLPAGARVRWTVRLANKKDAVVRPGRPPSEPLRPTLAPGRGDRVIDSGATHANVNAAVALTGSYRGQPVDLGELRLDTQQRLLVLGGRAKSASPSGAPIGASFYNNPDWYDDVSDGPVEAVIEMPDGRTESASPAWVVVGPPDFAPGCGGVVTLYDVLYQVGVDLQDLAVPSPPVFSRDIHPMLQRTANMRWVDNGASWPLVSDDWAALSNPSAASAQLRVENAGYVRDVEALLRSFSLQRWQHDCLASWESGQFVSEPVTSNDPGTEVTRAALDAAVGQGFFPGIEAGIIVTDPSIYLRPFQFRFDTAVVAAGDLTALMALPWQADFLKCNSGWWPTQRPDVAPQSDGSRPPWVRPPMNHRRFVADVTRLGIVTPVEAGGAVVHHELGRDPSL